MLAGLRQRNRNQAKERLNRFRRSSSVTAWTMPPRQQQQRMPPPSVVNIIRLRRRPGLVIATPPRREAIPYPEGIPPCSTIAVFRVPPPGRARIAWFFTKPSREGQGMPIVGKRRHLRMSSPARLTLSASGDSHMSLCMTATQRMRLAMTHATTIPLSMRYEPRL